MTKDELMQLWREYNDTLLCHYHHIRGVYVPTKKEVNKARNDLVVGLYMYIVDAKSDFKFYNKPAALDNYMQNELLLTMSRDLIFPNEGLEVFSEL